MMSGQISGPSAAVAMAPPSQQAPGRARIPLSQLVAQFGSSAYAAAAQFDRNIAMWNPTLRSADSEILRDAAKVRARARDLYRNDPYAKQIVRQAVLAVVGKKLRYKTRVDHEFLGIDQEEADRWGRQFDRVWETYAHGPGAYVDAGRRWNFSQLMRLALRARFVDGETIAAFEWAASRRFKTCVQLVDVDRISNPHGHPDSAALRGGVQLDEFSAPLGYYVRNGHPSDAGIDAATRSLNWTYVPRETAWGRPVMAHSYLPERIGQTRGISDFTTVIRTMRMEGEFAEADLASAIMQASYALVIKSSADYKTAMDAIGVDVEVDENGDVVNPLTDMMMQHLQAAAAYHNETKLTFGANRIPHLVPGEELQMVTPQNKATSAAEFSKHAIKRYAAGLGGDPIAVSQDYSEVNYSSARMSVASNWRGHEVMRNYRRAFVTSNFTTRCRRWRAVCSWHPARRCSIP
jgi:lambda family phage portal protein